MTDLLDDDFPKEIFGNHDKAIALLQSINAEPASGSSVEPSKHLLDFIEEVEGADLVDETDEDEKGLNWGHKLFSGRLGNVVKTWKDVANTRTACRLIAAIIKTCKLARHDVLERGINGSSYIADSYLDRTIDILWTGWEAENGVRPSSGEQSKKSSRPTSVQSDKPRKSTKSTVVIINNMVTNLKNQHASPTD
jgi:hypothetical protein